MTTHTVTGTDPGDRWRPQRRIGTVGTLTVQVPTQAWRYPTGGSDPHLAGLPDRVRDYIATTLIPEANKIMGRVCAGSDAAFIPDPLPDETGDCDVVIVRGLLILYAPPAWAVRLLDNATGPPLPGDADIAGDLDDFAHDTLIAVFDGLLAGRYPGADVWFDSDLADDPDFDLDDLDDGDGLPDDVG